MLFVTVGTMPNPMELLLKHLKELSSRYPREIVYQGSIPKGMKIPFESRFLIPRDEYQQYVKKAKLIVCHAGIGSIYDCITNQRKALVIPRRTSRNEHYNDHQMEVCAMLNEKRLPNIRILDDYDELESTINELEAMPFEPAQDVDCVAGLRESIMSDIDGWR